MPKVGSLKAKLLRRESYIEKFKSQKEVSANEKANSATSKHIDSKRRLLEEQIMELKERQGKWTKAKKSHGSRDVASGSAPIVFRPAILTDDQLHVPTQAELECQQCGWKALLEGELNSEVPGVSSAQSSDSPLNPKVQANIYAILDADDEQPKLPLFKPSIL